MKTTLLYFVYLTGSAVAKRYGGVKNQIADEGSLIQMLDVLGKAK